MELTYLGVICPHPDFSENIYQALRHVIDIRARVLPLSPPLLLLDREVEMYGQEDGAFIMRRLPADILERFQYVESVYVLLYADILLNVVMDLTAADHLT